MALNASSHNAGSKQTDPSSGQPPSLSDESKTEILAQSAQNPTGQSQPGQDGGDKNAAPKVKSEKELAKERAKGEKLKKFQEKQAKKAAAASQPSAKPKEKKKVKEDEKLAPYVSRTPSGEKKVMEDFESPYAKAYNPDYVEASWYQWWEKEGFFKPKFQEDGSVLPAGRFVIPIPPPNVTGNLHIGHALANALQDTLIRWYRMRGFTTLFVPGCDHAGIATQVVVEKRLWKTQKKTRHDIGREKLVEIIWDWKEEYHQRIRVVLRAMGGSYDWDREAFTMSSQLSKAVREHFVRLYDEGLIYRGNRLVNWCTHLRTSLSNLEVENINIEKKTLIEVPGYDKKVAFGVLLYFKYPIDGTDETITVATTRPETMLGDCGIAVNPKDTRYQHLIGKKARHPFVDRLLPIFADEYVDPEFGSGAVKMTPAHDQNDYVLGKKHNLEFINVLTEDGKLNANAGPLFEGQRRFDARYTVKTELEKRGLYVKEEDNPMTIPVCERSRDVVESILKPQFWVKMKDMAAEAKKAVEDGRIKVRPESSRKSYLRWMSDVQDWCISRQLWWGHRNPAWLVKFAGEPVIDDDEHWIAARDPEEAQKKAEAKFPSRKFELEQDPDVSDTWFSSGLFPFSSLGWPDKTEDFEKFFPMSVLETGWDILPFWVARMIMLSLKHTGQVPFNEVFCHSLVRDSEGRKMSKSLGNVISPLDVMRGITLEKLHEGLREGNLAEKEIAKAEKYQSTAFPQGIPECGADALRFSLVQYTTGGGDIAFSVNFIYAIRRFSNKIWQATKYCVGKFEEGFVPNATTKPGKESLSERWILSRMNHTVKRINEQLENREFSAATQALYGFIYENFCDVFIENSKALLEGSDEERRSIMNTLYTVNETSLLLLSPFMPFITEELWQRLPRRPEDSTPSITVAKFPVYDEKLSDPEAESAYQVILDASKAIRSLNAEYKISDAKLFVMAFDETTFKTLGSEHSSVRSLSGRDIASIDILSPDKATPNGCAVNVASAACAVFLEVRGHIQPEDEIAKAQKKLKTASEGAAKQRKVMSDPDWVEKVSPAVQEIEKARLEEYLAQERNYEQSIQQFEKLKLDG